MADRRRHPDQYAPTLLAFIAEMQMGFTVPGWCFVSAWWNILRRGVCPIRLTRLPMSRFESSKDSNAVRKGWARQLKDVTKTAGYKIF